MEPTKYPSISIDKVDQEVHNFENTPAAQPAVVQQQKVAAQAAGVAPPATSAPTMGRPPVSSPAVSAPSLAASNPELDVSAPDLKGMKDRVLETNKKLQEENPNPSLPLSNKQIGGLVAATTAVATGAILINKQLERQEKRRENSLNARRMNANPMMDVNTAEPTLKPNTQPSDLMSNHTAFGNDDPSKWTSVLDDYEPRATRNNIPTLDEELNRASSNIDIEGDVGNRPKSGMDIVESGSGNAAKKEIASELTAKGQPVKLEPVNPFEGSTELRTGTGKPAFEGVNPEGKLRSKYKNIQDVPKGLAFIPNAQYIDVPRNEVGQTTYTERYSNQEFPKTNEQARKEAGEINRSLGRETRKELEARGVKHQDMPEPTKGILEKIGGKNGSKVVTVGGVVGALTAIPNLVYAAQGAEEKDVQKSFGSLLQGVGQFLGPLGALGGEIFGISPEDLETVRKAEQARKVGGGRGIAPPSAYQR